MLLPSNLVKLPFRDTVCTAFHVDVKLANDARVIRYVKALTRVMLKGFQTDRWISTLWICISPFPFNPPQVFRWGMWGCCACSPRHRASQGPLSVWQNGLELWKVCFWLEGSSLFSYEMFFNIPASSCAEQWSRTARCFEERWWLRHCVIHPFISENSNISQHE